MTSEKLTILWEKYRLHTSSPQEEKELMQWLSDPVNEPMARQFLDKWYDTLEGAAIPASGIDAATMYRTILGRKVISVHRVHFLRTAWFRYAAAVIVIVGISSYLWWINKSQPASITTASTQHKNLLTDIAPGGDRATLTLADGSKIILDNTANGALVQQGNAQVIKLSNGQLAYQVKSAASQEVVMNTMTTPKGGQYKIQLPDGTNVWLNAASSITYPTAFTGAKREVMVNGEAYFEVKSNKTQPFLVKTTTSQVQVLGTSFNINAYENEIYKTSLIEGAIKVNDQLLAPGQAYTNGKVAQTYLDQDIAWKNGFFNLQGVGIQEAMREIQRWYDIEVVYEKGIPDIEFVGKMSRSLKLSELLNALEQVGVHFKMEGQRITIMP